MDIEDKAGKGQGGEEDKGLEGLEGKGQEGDDSKGQEGDDRKGQGAMLAITRRATMTMALRAISRRTMMAMATNPSIATAGRARTQRATAREARRRLRPLLRLSGPGR